MQRTEYIELGSLLVIIAAMALVVYGLHLWSEAAAFVVGGVFLFVAGMVAFGYALRTGGES